MKLLTSIFKALGDETRIRILHILSLGSFHVNEIVEILKMGQSRISRHLKILQEAGLIHSRREGTWIYYFLKRDEEKNFSNELTQLVDKYKILNIFYKKDFEKVQEIFNKRFQATHSFFNKFSDEAQKLHDQVLDSKIYRSTLLKFIPQNKNLLVDLGCGKGELFSYYLLKVKKVIGVDFSENMLSLAKKQNLPLSKIELIQSNLENLSLPDSIADVVVLSMVLHHISSPVLVLKEAYRILKNNGTLCVIELSKHENETMRNLYGDLWMGFEKETLTDFLNEAKFKIQTMKEIQTQTKLKILGFKTIKGEKK